MSGIKPCLWFATEAEEAARFYCSLLPNSRVDHVQLAPIDTPGGKAGTVLIVEFTLAGQGFQALNGGSKPNYDHSLSLSIACEDQAQLDRVWDALIADGGRPIECGWVADRYGVNWQVVPAEMSTLLGDPDPAASARVLAAVMTMQKLDIAALKAARDGRQAA